MQHNKFSCIIIVLVTNVCRDYSNPVFGENNFKSKGILVKRIKNYDSASAAPSSSSDNATAKNVKEPPAKERVVTYMKRDDTADCSGEQPPNLAKDDPPPSIWVTPDRSNPCSSPATEKGTAKALETLGSDEKPPPMVNGGCSANPQELPGGSRAEDSGGNFRPRFMGGEGDQMPAGSNSGWNERGGPFGEFGHHPPPPPPPWWWHWNGMSPCFPRYY